MAPYRVRIVTVDFHMANPIQDLDPMYSEFRGSSVRQVPVIRIFGSTDNGKKICLHVHGIFPYFYIPYEGSEDPNILMYQVAANVDKAINISFGQTSSTTQHVYKVVLVSGIPFYGYHNRKHQFLKIYLYNPVLIRKVSNLLQSDAVLGKIYQPHETHIPFVLQFMIDYNLHGMSKISLREMKFRMDRTFESSINEECSKNDDCCSLLPPTVHKISSCELEGDVLAEFILNRLEINAKAMINPGIAAIWADEKQRRRNKNQDSQIGHCLTLVNTNVPPTKTDQIFKRALVDKLALSDSDTSTVIEEKNSINASVYPAETPRDKKLLDASVVDFHSSASSDNNSSLNLSQLDQTVCPDLNASLNLSLNATLDGDAQNLFEILQNLGRNEEDIANCEAEEEAEVDSILTQKVTTKDDPEGDLDEDYFLDLSVPLDAFNTPVLDKDGDSDNDLNKTLVPQLDGNCGGESTSSDDSEISNNQEANKLTRKSYKALPISIETSKSSSDHDCGPSNGQIQGSLMPDPRSGVKRKLSFTPNPSEVTVIEENLVCELKPKIQKVVSFEKSPNKKQIVREYFSMFDTSDSDRSDEGLFDETLKDAEVTLTKAEKYDLESNYVAKEGHSKNMTQISIELEKKLCHKTSAGLEPGVLSRSQKSDSTSDVISNSLDSLKLSQEVPKKQQDSSDIFGECQSSFDEPTTKVLSSDSSTTNIILPYQLARTDPKPNDDSQENIFEPSQISFLDDEHRASKKNQTSSDSSTNMILPYQIIKTDIKSNFITNDPLGFSSAYLLMPQHKAPTRSDILNSLSKYNIARFTYQQPFYSNVDDVTGNVEVGHSVLKIASKTTSDLEDFKTLFDGLDAIRKIQMPGDLKWTRENINKCRLYFCKTSHKIIAPCIQPPTRKEVMNWTRAEQKEVLEPLSENLPPERTKIILPGGSPSRTDDCSDLELSLTLTPLELVNDDEIEQPNQPKVEESPILDKKRSINKKRTRQSDRRSGITGVTFNETFGFKVTPENYQNARAVIEYEHLTVLVIEVHVQTRGDFKPDPRYDPVRAIFYAIFEDSATAKERSGMIAVNSIPISPSKTHKFDLMQGVGVDCDVILTESESELFEALVKFVIAVDPDILTGYEIEMQSWGYLISRANILGISLVPQLARTKEKSYKDQDYKNTDDDHDLKVTGRIVLDFWRLMRYEIALQSYTFESIAYHILHRRLPQYSYKDLSFWWNLRSSVYRHRTINYYLLRVRWLLKIMEQLDLIGRTSELARLFGIQFYEVLSRGSQFRVESMMLRLAKPMNYIPVSPSVQQRAHMKAPEALPLILEPESKMYVDPVIVLDFQSLYPSIIMAYNYCYSTCIGRVQHLGKNTPFPFGATQYKIPRKHVEKLLKNDCLVFSPSGVAYVKKHIRDGIMPQMLREIIDTRLLVKQSMKENKEDKVLQKVLHNRQLGLKLIANVTFGYTSANFSGRMPAVELGDSIISKARETLQRAINLVEQTPEWGARVVYGDTDSLFVLVKGASRQEAFEVGKKIADAVTNDNPDPVKLKLEKVYQPCILQTKKRYVGYMYESPDQEEPVYQAKGIETVRRDGCPVVSKMLEKCLRILFETRDVSLIKQYVLRQFDKIFMGKVSLQDLTFAKEYRGVSGYKPGACVPALELARKWTAADIRNEPRCKERVPYVIINGPPGLPLIRLVRSPREFLADPSLRVNALYYITRVIIPPINRCLKLIGADLNVWFGQMPRKYHSVSSMPMTGVSPDKRNTISQYFLSTNCVSCGQQTQKGLCDTCVERKQETVVVLFEKIRSSEVRYFSTKLICESCSGIRLETPPCISLDCPVLYRLNQTSRDLQQVVYIRQVLETPDFDF